MNPRETQAGGSARDHLSAVEAHVKADSTTPACRLDRLCDPPMSPTGLVRKVTEHGFASTGEAMPTRGSEPKVTNLEGKTERDVER
jgi:hypothetical protein